MSEPTWSAVWILPFVVMLACIAVLPLVPRVSGRWERNSTKLVVALVLGLPVAGVAWARAGSSLVAHTLEEYVQFIALLAALFVVSGGLFLAGDIRATPRTNTTMLAVGALLASFVGTTGAAMLLIRPLLNTNRERERKVHTVVFAILVVANCGGLLTPLGDPPLYIGLMQGVPFTWTFHLLPEWLFVNGMLLVSYYALDHREYSRERPDAIAWDLTAQTPLRLRGAWNLAWLAVIVTSVAFLSDHVWIKVAVQVSAALGSYLTTSRSIRFDDNEFHWAPIIEVTVLFAGIFLTMIPALEVLREHAHDLPLNVYTLFGFSGALSSVLDNAPTYLTFFEMATQLHVPGAVVVAGVPDLYLRAISLGAVTCGAVTYIGNGPNFMVKAIADKRGIPMPSFGGYVRWALGYLVPTLVAMVCLFLATSGWARAAGVLVTLGVLTRSAVDVKAGSRTAAPVAP